MSCSNCYNGCPEIVSDQCVRYTGIDVPILGITHGDSVSFVEQQIVNFLVSTLDGSGILPKIEESIICDTIKNNLPTCGELNVVDFLKALIKSVCEIKLSVTTNSTDITVIKNFITSLEGPYITSCLSGVTSTSGTHAILQAVINKLCDFISTVGTTYVKVVDINTYISNYLTTLPASSKYYTRMIPFVAYEFYPDAGILSKFVNGVGTAEWEKVYFCNGDNGTPDKRGRVAVGVTSGMVGGPLPAATAPGGLNPTYTVGVPVGSNSTILTINQIPKHTHLASTSATATISPNPHDHGFSGDTNFDFGSGSVPGGRVEHTSPGAGNVIGGSVLPRLLSASVNVTVVNSEVGLDQAHTNVQTGIGAYYIMYIP